VTLFTIVAFVFFSFVPSSAYSETFNCVARSEYLSFYNTGKDRFSTISKFKIVTAGEEVGKLWLGTHPVDFRFKGPFKPINLKLGVKIGKIFFNDMSSNKSRPFFQTRGFNGHTLVGFYFTGANMTLIRIHKGSTLEESFFAYNSEGPFNGLMRGRCE